MTTLATVLTVFAWLFAVASGDARAQAASVTPSVASASEASIRSVAPIDCDRTGGLGYIVALQCTNEPSVKRLVATVLKTSDCTVGIGSFLVPEAKIDRLLEDFADARNLGRFAEEASRSVALTTPAGTLLLDLESLKQSDQITLQQIREIFDDGRSLPAFLNLIAGLLSGPDGREREIIGEDVTQLARVGSCLDILGRIVRLTSPTPIWSTAKHIDSDTALNSVSCPTTTFCMAVDNGGNAFTYSSGTWSAADSIARYNPLASVSCPTTTFCAAVTANGSAAYIYASGVWSSSELVGADGSPASLSDVSCPQAGFCIAIGDFDSYTYSDGSWARGVSVDNSDALLAISCPSTSYCLAVSFAGNGYTYSGGTWSSAVPIINQFSLAAVSCPTSTFCVANPRLGRGPEVYADQVWSASQLLAADGKTATLIGVSCPQAGFCVAVGQLDGYTYSGGRWAKGVLVTAIGALDSISCPSVSYCVAVDDQGNAYTYS